MAIDYALSQNATHLLFIDSDVIPHPGGVAKLISLDVGLCGGLVPGRGVHRDLRYMFPGKLTIRDHGNLYTCGYGTCGYMLIKREVFERLRFRYGDDSGTHGELISEDQAYCEDWNRMSGVPFHIHKEATADHIDSPTNPLTADGVARDNWNEIQS